jgi:hypothetical protein
MSFTMTFYGIKITINTVLLSNLGTSNIDMDRYIYLKRPYPMGDTMGILIKAKHPDTHEWVYCESSKCKGKNSIMGIDIDIIANLKKKIEFECGRCQSIKPCHCDREKVLEAMREATKESMKKKK